MGREALGDGSPNRGFAIDPVFPPPPSLILKQVDTTGLGLNEAIGAIIGACLADLLSLMLYMIFGPLLFFLDFPGDSIDDFESANDWTLSSPQGTIRLGRDSPVPRPRLSASLGACGSRHVTKTLTNVRDLSAYDLATLRFRTNEQVPGTFKFFIEDAAGNRSVWDVNNTAFARDFWLAGFASPLDISFRILTGTLGAAVVNKSYSGSLFTYGGRTPMTWAVTQGALPGGLTLAPAVREMTRALDGSVARQRQRYVLFHGAGHRCRRQEGLACADVDGEGLGRCAAATARCQRISQPDLRGHGTHGNTSQPASGEEIRVSDLPGREHAARVGFRRSPCRQQRPS
jgi:hypothetical protein